MPPPPSPAALPHLLPSSGILRVEHLALPSFCFVVNLQEAEALEALR